jgi:hypothetical protein
MIQAQIKSVTYKADRSNGVLTVAIVIFDLQQNKDVHLFGIISDLDTIQGVINEDHFFQASAVDQLTDFKYNILL